MFREVQIGIDLPAVEIVEVDALGRGVGRLSGGHEAEHAAEHAAAAGALLVGAERLGGRGGRVGRGGRGGRRGRGGRGGRVGAAHGRLGQLAPAPRLRALVAGRRGSRQLHLRVRLHGRPVTLLTTHKLLSVNEREISK